jgi:hypothetical protein
VILACCCDIVLFWLQICESCAHQPWNKSFDEMSLRKELKYNAAKDQVDGLVELPEKKPVACNQALVFMLKGLAYKWKQPLSFYFSENAAAACFLKEILTELMRCIQAKGLSLVALVCDQGSCNRSLYRMLGISCEKPFFEVCL